MTKEGETGCSVKGWADRQYLGQYTATTHTNKEETHRTRSTVSSAERVPGTARVACERLWGGMVGSWAVHCEPGSGVFVVKATYDGEEEGTRNQENWGEIRVTEPQNGMESA